MDVLQQKHSLTLFHAESRHLVRGEDYFMSKLGH